MKADTAKLIEAQIALIAGMDSTITQAQISAAQQAAIAALNGEADPARLEIQKPMTRAQVAALMGVSKDCVSRYARRGMIQPVACGTQRQRAIRYTAASVRALMAGQASKAS